MRDELKRRAPLGVLALILASVAVARTLSYDGSSGDALLMLLGVGLFVLLQAALLALRADDVIRIIYGYLATFYFGNRVLSEVWLGPSTELGAGTVAPLLLGDLVLLEVVLRRRIRVPASWFLYLTLALLPAASLFLAPGVASDQTQGGFHFGSFVYQYLVLARAATVAIVLVRLLRRSSRRVGFYLRHVGLIFAALGFLTALIAVATGARFGLPGWGVNVYANALAVVGALCGWQAIHQGERRLFNWVLFVGCTAGVVGSGTRLALLVLLGVVLWSLLARLLARRMPLQGHVSVGIVAGVIFVGAAGSVIALAGELNPRFTAIGGIEVTAQTQPLEVLEAVQRESSVRTRLTLWQASSDMFLQSPLIGVGWGQWNWLKGDFGATFPVLLDPHNGYLWAVAEGGFIGLLVVYGALLALLFYLRPTLPIYGILLVLVLELTNANLQKGLYAVLVSVLMALGWRLHELLQANRSNPGAAR